MTIKNKAANWDRDVEIFRRVCEGSTIGELAKLHGVCRSRVDQIIAKYRRVANMYFGQMQVRFGKQHGYIVPPMDVFDDFHARSKKLQHDAWFFLPMAKVMHDPKQMENVYWTMREYQAGYTLACKHLHKHTVRQFIKLTNIREAENEIERYAKETEQNPNDVLRVFYLACYALNPNVISSSSGLSWDLKWYLEHSRLFLNPVEVDFGDNLKYIHLLPYLNEGEKPKALTVPYLWELYQRKHKDIAIVVLPDIRLSNNEAQLGRVTTIGDTMQPMGFCVLFDENGPRVAKIREGVGDSMTLRVSSKNYMSHMDLNNPMWKSFLMNFFKLVTESLAKEAA